MTGDKKPEDSDPGESATDETVADPVEPDAVETAAAGELAEALDERTRDLQRVTAEYHNYRKRVDRDRQAVADQATVNVVVGLLPVLDDIDRAREHGDLVGPFASVAEQLLNLLTKLGLEVFGDKGDVFDPVVHEAVAHMHSAEVTEATCIDVMRRGYRLNDRLVRPAMVAVAEPADEPAPASAASVESDSAEPKDAAADDEAPTSQDTGDTDTEKPGPDVDATGEKSTGASTENLDADVPADEEALKGEVVEAAVAEATEEADAEADESPEAAEDAATEGESGPTTVEADASPPSRTDEDKPDPGKK